MQVREHHRQMFVMHVIFLEPPNPCPQIEQDYVGLVREYPDATGAVRLGFEPAGGAVKNDFRRISLFSHGNNPR
uniref:Uncharacterized protein n=1 Tax=Candidatus Kentrum sp. TUN TaxID=2126343 RepID=A0A451ACK4_9GAMM|nr:MAG: hypothetical protein BECKTUN1418D_GA0071000_12244 [Candidatus Kentron sp. TUN]